MEEFKICEKETKTKAFSKEGLAREEKLNPREVEKEEKRVWIQTVVEQIEGVVEGLETELERVSNLKGKGKNKEQVSFSCLHSLSQPPLLNLIESADGQIRSKNNNQSMAYFQTRTNQSIVGQ